MNNMTSVDSGTPTEPLKQAEEEKTDLNKVHGGRSFKKLENVSIESAINALTNSNDGSDVTKTRQQPPHVELNPEISEKEANITFPTSKTVHDPSPQLLFVQNPQEIQTAEKTNTHQASKSEGTSIQQEIPSSGTEESTEMPPFSETPIVSPPGAPITSAALTLPPRHTGEQYEAAAIKGTTTNPNNRTKLHQTYDKAAEAYTREGRVEDTFRVRAKVASELKMSSTHPLHKMNAAIEEKVAQQEGIAREFGAHFSGLDTGVVKGGNIRINRRNIDGMQKDVMEFRMSQFARRDLQANLHQIENNLTAFIDSLPPELKTQVTITEIPYTFKGNENGVFSDAQGLSPRGAQAIQIEFPGIGKVIIGNTQGYGCLYNNVSVEIDANLADGVGLDRMHQMLSVLGCGPILAEQRPQDDERMRFAVLVHTMFPKEAVQLERTKEFYELPLKDLKIQVRAFLVSKYDPDQIDAILNKYEQPDMMKKVEIYPGKSVWAVCDLGDQMRSKGAKGLMMGITKLEHIAYMLTYGCLSSQDRLQAGMMVMGASTLRDLMSAGGDTAFARLINDMLINEEITSFDFCGDYQLLIDLDACNQGAYGFDDDGFGVKNPSHPAYDSYVNRQNLIELSETQRASNEIMIKNRIGPEHIRGIVVKNMKVRMDVKKYLNDCGLVEMRGSEQYVLGKPINEFVQISGAANKFKETMWNKPA